MALQRSEVHSDSISSARAGRVGERHRDLAAVDLVDEHKLTAIGGPQLLVGIEQLDHKLTRLG